jgi:hypothetical protein
MIVMMINDVKLMVMTVAVVMDTYGNDECRWWC